MYRCLERGEAPNRNCWILLFIVELFYSSTVICDRLARVYSRGLEESVQKFLEMQGKLNRVYLTALEEKVLSLLESEVKV
ncbi:MAG: hypothetical protein ACYTXI_33705 [Nostoc sp.]